MSKDTKGKKVVRALILLLCVPILPASIIGLLIYGYSVGKLDIEFILVSLIILSTPVIFTIGLWAWDK